MATEHALAAKEKTHQATKFVLNALKHIPDDKLDWVPMGKAKTPLLIVVECAAVYKWLASEYRGESNTELFEAMMKAEYSGRDEVVALLEASQAEMDAAMDALTEEQLTETREVFWGPTTVDELLGAGKMHSDYHAGQLNYIQTLLGDDEMHGG